MPTADTKKRVTPGEGGCWFCYRKDHRMMFDIEFDTYVHLDCIRKALAQQPDHPEANLMRYLLEGSP